MRSQSLENRLFPIEEHFARFLEKYNMWRLPQAEQDRLWLAYSQGAHLGREANWPAIALDP